MVAMSDQVGGELVLPKLQVAHAALGNVMVPAKLIEKDALLVAQLARRLTVEMDDAVVVERDRVVRSDPAVSIRSMRRTSSDAFVPLSRENA